MVSKLTSIMIHIISSGVLCHWGDQTWMPPTPVGGTWKFEPAPWTEVAGFPGHACSLSRLHADCWNCCFFSGNLHHIDHIPTYIISITSQHISYQYIYIFIYLYIYISHPNIYHISHIPTLIISITSQHLPYQSHPNIYGGQVLSGQQAEIESLPSEDDGGVKNTMMGDEQNDDAETYVGATSPLKADSDMMECDQDQDVENTVVPPKAGLVPTPVRAIASQHAGNTDKPEKNRVEKPKSKAKAKAKAKSMAKKASPKTGSRKKTAKASPKKAAKKAKEAKTPKTYKAKVKDAVEKKLHSVAKLAIIVQYNFQVIYALHVCKPFSNRNAIESNLSCIFALRHFSKVYSSVHKVSKNRGLSAEESKTRANEARWQWPSIANHHFGWNMCSPYLLWLC